MGAQGISGQRIKVSRVHPGWLQPELLSSLSAHEHDSAPISTYLPADDPCLQKLINRLQRDFPLASEVTFFAGNMDESEGKALESLLHEHGWLVVARHRLQTRDVVTEHLVATGNMPRGPIPADVCQHLTMCSFDRMGSLETPDAIVTELMKQVRQISTEDNHKLHRQRVQETAPPRPQEPLSIKDLDRGLDAIERRARKMRKRIAAIPFKTDEYYALERELDGIVQEFHATLKQRRALRLERRKASPRPAKGDRPATSKTRETLDPLVIVRWNLEP